jgi:hypothetical protein
MGKIMVRVTIPELSADLDLLIYLRGIFFSFTLPESYHCVIYQDFVQGIIFLTGIEFLGYPHAEF